MSRGRHRANRFSRRVTDLQAEIQAERADADVRRGLACVVANLLSLGGAR